MVLGKRMGKYVLALRVLSIQHHISSLCYNFLMNENIIKPNHEVEQKGLRLKLANLEDAQAEYDAIRSFPVGEHGLSGLAEEWRKSSYQDFLEVGLPRVIDNHFGKQLKPGYVPCSTYFLWDKDQIVGIFNFRHYLCESLKKFGGHIGYAILPDYRGQHYATRGLKLLIEEVSNKVPEDELWLDAYTDNIASQRVMLNNGAYIAEQDDEMVHMRIKLNKHSDIVKEIETLIRQKSDNYLKNDPGKYDFWNGHLKYVYQEATILAGKYGADLEIVQLGALLHDIALLEKVGTKADHHENGKVLAEKILRRYGFPEDKLKKVLGCVLHHRSSKNTENVEETCVADADILAHFDNIPMLFDAAYNLHKMVGIENVRKFMRDSFEKDFADLSEQTKAEFTPRYQVIRKVVLGD